MTGTENSWLTKVRASLLKVPCRSACVCRHGGCTGWETQPPDAVSDLAAQGSTFSSGRWE